MVIDGDFSSRLSTSFVFLPRIVADPPSPLRAIVYAEGGVTLGPEADPEEGFQTQKDSYGAWGKSGSSRLMVVVVRQFTYASNSPCFSSRSRHGRASTRPICQRS